VKPLGPSMTIPAQVLRLSDDSSTKRTHACPDEGIGPWSSAAKSAKCCPLTDPLGSYFSPNSDNSTDQAIILPARSGFRSILAMG